jgi:hypothetical protein
MGGAFCFLSLKAHFQKSKNKKERLLDEGEQVLLSTARRSTGTVKNPSGVTKQSESEKRERFTPLCFSSLSHSSLRFLVVVFPIHNLLQFLIKVRFLDLACHFIEKYCQVAVLFLFQSG